MVVLPLPGPYMPHPKPGLGRKKKHTASQLLGISIKTSNKSEGETPMARVPPLGAMYPPSLMAAHCNVPRGVDFPMASYRP